MNMVLPLSLLLTALIVSLGVFFTIRMRRVAVKRQVGHRPLRRFGRQHLPGITPLILRASRPRRAVHPPVIQVLPHAVASSSPPEEQQAAQKQAASQTTVYALPVSHTLKLSSCPRCSKPTATHDVFCGACGMRLHRSAQTQE
jgi:hypothetical protein